MAYSHFSLVFPYGNVPLYHDALLVMLHTGKFYFVSFVSNAAFVI